MLGPPPPARKFQACLPRLYSYTCCSPIFGSGRSTLGPLGGHCRLFFGSPPPVLPPTSPDCLRFFPPASLLQPSPASACCLRCFGGCAVAAAAAAATPACLAAVLAEPAAFPACCTSCCCFGGRPNLFFDRFSCSAADVDTTFCSCCHGDFPWAGRPDFLGCAASCRAAAAGAACCCERCPLLHVRPAATAAAMAGLVATLPLIVAAPAVLVTLARPAAAAGSPTTLPVRGSCCGSPAASPRRIRGHSTPQSRSSRSPSSYTTSQLGGGGGMQSGMCGQIRAPPT